MGRTLEKMGRDLESKIPNMQCDPWCGKCCGVVAATPKEFAIIEKYIDDNKILPLRQGITCPFYQNGICAIYPVRPITCKLFGHVPEMPCPRGYSVMVRNPRIFRRWLKKQANPHDFRTLHELAGYQTEEVIKFFKSR